jgi:deoxycytidine triphosphate deaminase
VYLSDRDIRALLDQMRFETANPKYPFVPDDQIQPCSVDLRLDATLWVQRSRRPIDLRRAKLLELDPRRYWRRITLGEAESITVKPQSMVLGRTFESFSIPPEYAGKLEGRSSFNRMGLAVHCSGDFINPGWRGRMPLQLVNFGKSPITLFPHIPICQLIIVPLSSRPTRLYGERELSSKYMDDDGGPSYWWRDGRIKQLQQALGEHDVAERLQLQILELIGPQDPELVERFERIVRKLPREKFTNAEELLESFAKQEDDASFRARLFRGVQIGLAPLLVAATIGSLFSQPFGSNKYGWLHYALWMLTGISIPISIISYKRELGDYFGSKQLRALRQNRDGGIN